MESSSDSGPTIDERLDTLEHAMDRLKLQTDSQDQWLQETKVAGEQSWNLLNEDIKKLRADLSASLENMEEFKEDVQTDFKDNANTHGDFGKRICALEQSGNKLLAKMDKWSS